MSGPVERRRGRGVLVGVVALAVALVVVFVLNGQRVSGRPFDVASSAPDGYRALAILLRDQGAEVRSSSASQAAEQAATAGEGDVIMAPAPGLASRAELSSWRAAAERGATVILGDTSGVDDSDDGGGMEFHSGRDLADEPALRALPGSSCEIAALDGLGAVDNAFAPPVDTGAAETCYGSSGSSLVGREPVGPGQVVTLASPYLLVNARLQPDKEDGGQPLDNAALAFRLFGPAPAGVGPGVRITVIDAVPSVEPVRGGESLIDLVPLPVKLALAQGLLAFVLYAAWRSRRLGRPVVESVPVDIAGSELVVAVGDLLRRKGNPDRAAVVLRRDCRRELSRLLGVAPNAAPELLVQAVAQRSGRSTDEVWDALSDSPVRSTDSLVALARTLRSIRQEVTNEQLPVG